MDKFIVIVLTLIWTLITGCERPNVKVNQTLIERGKYLVTIGGCNDCHTPKVQGPNGSPEFDEKRLLSGHPETERYPIWSSRDMEERSAATLTNWMLTAWAGPWGVSFAANLTPDKETGIEEWSEQHFFQAIRTGKHQGQPNGREILPPMPWFNLRHMNDDDLKAVWAYLRSIPPVKNQVPFPVPAAVITAAR